MKYKHKFKVKIKNKSIFFKCFDGRKMSMTTNVDRSEKMHYIFGNGVQGTIIIIDKNGITWPLFYQCCKNKDYVCCTSFVFDYNLSD